MGTIQIVGLVLIFVVMYMLMIRPQKKREKAVNEMRNALKVGDEIVTIGGIKGKIVNTKDDFVTIAVGSDKVKFEVMRWGISKVEGDAPQGAKQPVKQEKTAKEEPVEEQKPARKPRKLGAGKETAAVEAVSEESANTESSETVEE
jgi:preprotein translocase YajC subunit